jgi:hypothetical protein
LTPAASAAAPRRPGIFHHFQKLGSFVSAGFSASTAECDASNLEAIMPKPTYPETPVDAVADGGHFATMPKHIAHVTFYFDLTPKSREDDEFFFVKVETQSSVNPDLDTWYDAALAEILARNTAVLAGAEVTGVAITFGNSRSGVGGEAFYRIDGDSTDVDSVPGGTFVQGRDFNGNGVEYSYGDLFS